jgi:hypothetical protein
MAGLLCDRFKKTLPRITLYQLRKHVYLAAARRVLSEGGVGGFMLMRKIMWNNIVLCCITFL